MNWKRRGSGRVWPTGGSKLILGLAALAWISLIGFGCAPVMGGGTGPYRPTFPPVPEFVMKPAAVQGTEGREYIVLAKPDWLQLGTYILELERQLTGACLALGGSAKECHAEDTN